jgi:cysteine desulfurase family protein (TIGR01976 family)
MDVRAARSRFASLSSGFVFLDAPGGTQVPDEVAAAVVTNYREASGNLGAPYATSQRLGALLDDSRQRSAAFFGCSVDEVVFGANMTSLNFTLTRTLGRTLREGDEIVVTRLDHDGNVAPWLELAHDIGIVVRIADVHDDTTLDLDDVARQLGPRTRVVAFPWAANSVGTTVDAGAVARLAHDAGALAWIDAVQYAPHLPMDVVASGADVVLCSSYKFCGPHLGLAYGRRELFESWRPYKVRPQASQPVGRRFETGTPPYELLAALLASLDYIESLGGVAAMAEYERVLGDRFLERFRHLDETLGGANLYGLPAMEGRVPTFLVNFDGVSSDELSAALAERGFGVWSHGHYYALGLHERIGWGEALRIGLCHYNTLEEVDHLAETLGELVTALRAGVGSLTTANR